MIKTSKQILDQFIEANSPFATLVSSDDAIKAMELYADQFRGEKTEVTINVDKIMDTAMDNAAALIANKAPSQKPKIYIAGKVTGTKTEECEEKFGSVQRKLEAQGYEVINPLEVVGDPFADWIPAMKKCLRAMLGCEQIYFLSDWKDSKGAKVEHTLSWLLRYDKQYQSK